MSKFNDSILYVDGDPNTIIKYNINDIAKGLIKPYKLNKYSKTAFNTTIMINDSTIIYQAKNDKYPYRFCEENLNNRSFISFGKFPEEDNIIKNIPSNDYSQLTAYQGKIIYNNEKKKAVAYYLYAVGFDIIDIEKKTIIKSNYFQYPKVECVSMYNTHFIKNIKESKRGYIDAYCDKQFIYFLFSNKTFLDKNISFGKYIAKFDWQGNPIEMYCLDRDINCFTISKDGKYLFGVSPMGENFSVNKFYL